MMETSYIINDKLMEKGMQSLQRAATDVRVKGAEKIVNESTAPINAYKMLTLNIVTSCKDRDSQNRIVDMIEAWSLDLNKCRWHGELIEFCKSKDDIAKAISAKNGGKTEFIIVMDDSSVDRVLEYNGFAFDLRRKYDEIYDFMVLDANTSNGIGQMFEEINVLYERGSRSGNSAGSQE